MQKSDELGELSKALSNVQKKLSGAKKDSANPFFKSKYADLTSVWEACRDLLADNGLAVIQTTEPGYDGQVIIETVLTHSSGQWISGSLPMILPKQDPQGIGSAITYGRRYGLAAIVGVSPEDDDAESAIERKPKKSLTEQAIEMGGEHIATETVPEATKSKSSPSNTQKSTISQEDKKKAEDDKLMWPEDSGNAKKLTRKQLIDQGLKLAGWKPNAYGVWIKAELGIEASSLHEAIDKMDDEQFQRFQNEIAERIKRKENGED